MRREYKFRGGFTLLEILLVFGLTAVILAGLSSMIQLFSRHYATNERRVGRAQLARSISQTLSEDLGSAVQDPIQNVVDDPTRDYVRHFGLRGDSRSLQIDVVQPNPFALVADAEENRRVAGGADKTVGRPQAPELKTVFYEFVPINEPIQRFETSSSTANTTGDGTESGLSGSLSSSPTASLLESERPTDFWDGLTPLKRKYGLSRRELDYETPEEEDESETSETDLFDPASGEAGLAGSLTQPPSLENSTLASGAGDAQSEEKIDEDDLNSPLTAAQVAMDSDNGVYWAPEVLDCRFSYFDGQNWLDAWDSLEKNGLPLAIKVELKLAPLDDVDLFRESPYLVHLPLAPKLDDVADAIDLNASDTGASALTGSLTQVASEKADPIDVFNTYRPLVGYRLAARGVTTTTNVGGTPFDKVDDSGLQSGLQGAQDSETNEVDESGLAGIGGGLNSLGGDAPASGDSLGGSLEAKGESSFEERAQELGAAGVVYNEAGVCVDFANDGSYMTLEQIADEMGIAQPIVYEVISYLPTTPYSRAKVVERRRPATVARGRVNTPGSRPANVGGRGADRANPYASGQARAPRQRTVTERAPRERAVNERNVASRGPTERGAAQRNRAERTVNERGANNRQTRERNATERVATQRNVRERNVGTGVAGVNFDPTGAPVGVDSSTALNASAMTLDSNSRRQALEAQNGGINGALNGGLTGGLSGGGLGGSGLGGLGGGATTIDSLDPFAIVNETTSSVPFAEQSSPFDEVNSAIGATAPGLIESNSGFDTVVTPNPSTPPRQTSKQKNQQAWIRGKK